MDIIKHDNKKAINNFADFFYFFFYLSGALFDWENVKLQQQQ